MAGCRRLVDARVDDLMHRMSLREKLAQLYSLWVGIDDAGQVAPHQHEFAASSSQWEDLATYGLGQLTRPYGTSPVDPISGPGAWPPSSAGSWTKAASASRPWSTRSA